VTLSRHPSRRPVHAAYVPLLYGLSELRVFAPFWSSHERYCRFPHAAGAGVEVSVSSLEHAGLLAHDVAYLSATGALTGSWHVVVAPHMAGTSQTTLAIEPAGPRASPREIEADLRRLGEGLAARIRRVARLRLTMLRRARSGDDAAAELSVREREVLDLFLSGLGVTSIARELFISAHTVRNHLKHLYAKLQVTCQDELRELFAASGG
jgi:DNA-binding CsgD family transcriptional regulator